MNRTLRSFVFSAAMLAIFAVRAAPSAPRGADEAPASEGCST